MGVVSRKVPEGEAAPLFWAGKGSVELIPLRAIWLEFPTENSQQMGVW